MQNIKTVIRDIIQNRRRFLNRQLVMKNESKKRERSPRSDSQRKRLQSCRESFVLQVENPRLNHESSEDESSEDEDHDSRMVFELFKYNNNWNWKLMKPNKILFYKNIKRKPHRKLLFLF